ncbi:hypothetical protein [Fundidesulfovibrio agrisoli]|uniref:hypothetical protein n=1 Tax=Fundidesulfovibrio agrisoli TaxID=2922717 RepID=UPI001FAE0F0E|nr:hypothetical protein [Fundidesulfovibrio agrisoli]
MHSQPTNRKRWLAAAALAAALGMAATGCTPKQVPQPAPEPSLQAVPSPETLESLDAETAYTEGLQAFWSGNYRASAALFDAMARRVEDQAMRSKALFGLACARLAGAENAEDFKAARAVWQEWEHSSGGNVDQADPRMLTPFLMNAKLFAPQREPKQPAPAAKASVGEQELSRRLQEKEKEVLLLQKQIKALEAIHREIQEKKKMTAQ